MSMNRAELARMVQLIEPLITGGAIQKVFEQDRDTWVFRVRADRANQHLLASARPGFTRLYLVDDKPDQPPHPTAFTMQLRKWVEGARVTSIELLPDDRIVRVQLDVRNPEPDEDPRERRNPSLILELTGRHGCAYLLDEDDVIIGQSHRFRGLGEHGPGDEWSPPEPSFEPDTTLRWDSDAEDVYAVCSKLAEHFAASIVETERLESLRELRSRLKREAGRLKRRLSAVEKDLERAENAEAHKRRAELLQGAYNQDIPRGATSVTVTDYWDSDMAKVDIPLEPRLSLQENIDRAFHQYRRLSEATDRIESRLLETMELTEQVADARESLRDDLSRDEIETITRKLVSDGVLPRKRKQTTSADGPRLPYRTYRSTHGKTIMVGRNSKANDQLTTKVARGRDIWLHARDWPGSHVVMRMNKGEDPRSDDLLDAAILAAHFCKGSSDTLVDVLWTHAKHVRKPKGAAPGLVTHSGGSNIVVRRDEKRLQRLLATLETD